MSGPRIRDRHATPPRLPWLVPVIVVVAAIVVVGGILLSLALGIRFF